jgi:hypothetical protein
VDLYRRYGSDNPKATFRLLFITRHGNVGGDDNHRLAEMIVQALELPDGTLSRMWFTTVRELAAGHESDQETLGQALWIKGADVAAWRGAYRAFASRPLPGKKIRPSLQHKREYTLERMGAIERHAMFPAAATKKIAIEEGRQ